MGCTPGLPFQSPADASVNFGRELDLDGTTLAVGDRRPFRNPPSGAVYMYGLDGMAWSLSYTVTRDNAQANIEFGF